MSVEELVYVYICLSLTEDGVVAELMQVDPWLGPDGQITGRSLEGTWETIVIADTGPVDLAAADAMLTMCGYQRLTDWRTRTGRTGREIHSADACIRIEDIR